MKLTKDTRLKDILAAYPWLIDEAVKVDGRFRALRSPLGKLLIRRATVAEAAEKVGATPDEAIEAIEAFIQNHSV